MAIVSVVRIITYEGEEAAVRAALQKSLPLGIKEVADYKLIVAEHYNGLPNYSPLTDRDVADALDSLETTDD